MIKTIATHSLAHQDQTSVLKMLQTYYEQLGPSLCTRFYASRVDCNAAESAGLKKNVGCSARSKIAQLVGLRLSAQALSSLK